MNLQGRNLSQGIQGDDVQLLQSELRQLGYAIADAEVAKTLFGETTRLAVIDFQKTHGLTEDGIVGVNTARELSVAIAGMQDPKNNEPKNSELKPSDRATTLPPKSEPKSSDSAAKLSSDGEPKPPADIRHIPYVIQGQLRQTDDKPAVGLTVSAFDDKDGIETLLGESVSDQGGLFKITYPEELFHNLSRGRNRLDMILRVFDSPHNMKQGWSVVRITQPIETLDPRVVSWLPWKEPETKPFSVAGNVRWPGDRPAPNLVVRAFDKDLRNEEELGTAVTDTNGHYQINYSAAQFRRAEKDSADLIVRAYDDKNAVVGSSFPPIIFNSQPDETVDLSLKGEVRGLSEYEMMIKELMPLLEDVRLSELVENEEHQDISFLAGETGFDPQRIIWLVQAAKLTNEASSPEETERDVKTRTHMRTLQAGTIPEEVFYGLLRQNLPASLTELLAQDSRLLHSALQRSAQDSIIPPLSALELDEIINRLRALKARLMLKASGENQQPSLGDLLKTSQLTPNKQRIIAELQVDHDGASESFWKALNERNEFSEEEIKAVRLTLQLGTLTGSHLPLILELQRITQTDRAVAKAKSVPASELDQPQEMTFVEANANELRPFAKLDVTDWKTLLLRPQADGQPIGAPSTTPGADLQEKIDNYAAALSQHIENLLPTPVIASRLEKDTSDDNPFKSAQADLKTFFDNNSSFEFRTTPVDLYLSEGRGQKLEDVTDPAALMAQLKRMQRVFNITPRYPEIRALLADDLHSALAIVHVGERRFTGKYAEPLGGPSKALELYRKAAHVHATALNVYMKHSIAFNSPLPYVISGGEMERSDPQTSDIRNRLAAPPTHDISTGVDWRTLFGSLDLCNCHHCLSLYSPAAYLVDILKFLRDGPVKDGRTPLDVLLARRPDIGHIELTCENTNTQLPYVDLVNEVLEEALMPSPIGHWEFDEGQGKIALDASANGNNATLQALSGSGPIWETGKIGTNSLSFDGDFDYVQVPADKRQTLADTGSICAWIYPKGVGSFSPRGTIIAREGEFIISWQLSSNGGAIDWSFPNREPSEQWHAAGGYIAPVNEWTHIAVVFDKGKVKTYANGQLVDDASGTGRISPDTSPAKEITIGGRLGVTQFFNGLIDDVRVYDGVLNSEEVRTSAQARPKRQTRSTAQELAANPEYINNSAYELLSKAVYPWSLPLNLPLEEVRTYLRHLGVQRHEVIETLLASKAAFETDFALEYLGLATEEADIITGATTGGPVGTPTPVGDWDFWGLRDAENDIVDRSDGTAPHARGEWDVVLQRVSIFLQQSGLSYKELLELLGTYFVNPSASAGTPGGRLLVIAPPVICNLSELELQVVDIDIPDKKEELKAVWNRIHRFVRLWRKLGWTMRDLDKAIKALPKNSDGQIDIDFDALLINLANIQRLHIETGLPVVNLLGWWADIDTVSYVDQLADGEPTVASLYAKLFSNKTVSGQLVGENPAALSGTLSGKAAAIAAALQISVEDFTLLHADENVIPRIPAPADPTQTILDDHLSLVNLSSLYRHATLAKALKLPIRTYLSTLALVDGSPFATTGRTIQFIKHIDKIHASGFRIEDLDYLLRHKFSATSDIDATDDVIATVLDAMRDDLRKVVAENTFVAAGVNDNAATSDPNGDLTRNKLALLNWDPALIEQAIAVLSDSATYEATLNALPAGTVLSNDTGTYQVTLNALPTGFVFPSLMADVVTYDETNQKLKAQRVLTQAERTILLNASTTDLTYQSAVKELFKLQDELKGKVSYNNEARKLRFVGTMTPVRQIRLKNASSETDYQKVVDALFNAPRAFILRNMRTFSVQNFKAPLHTLPQTVKFPTALKSKAYYDVAAKELRFISAMTEAERDILLNLSSDVTNPYKTAINTLFDAPNNLVPQSRDTFLITFGPNNHATTLFDNPTATPEDRFLLVLKNLLPYLQTALSELVVKQRLGEYLKLDATAIDGLLKKWVKPQVIDQDHPELMAIADFLDPVFVESNPNVRSSKDAFPHQFHALLLLYKIATLILKFNMTPRQLQWLFDSSLNVRWLDLNALPLDATAQATALFKGWERLVELFQVRDALPRGEALLTDIFTAATAPGAQTAQTADDAQKELYKVLEILSKGTQWELGSLKSLSGVYGFNLSVSDFAGSGSLSAFAGESALLRLSVAFAMLKRLGASADQCLTWAKPSPTGDDARELKSVVRAKYDDAQWLELAKALRDPLRERQRSALVAYLVQKFGVRDANELYDDFLIDVEMSPCMMTTRIKQAISSVQLFIQRGLMNLESDVSLTPKEAQEWAHWRKWYRVWEANRKVLLYPENWIEPELRDDKSPFFKDLENELLQSEVTMATAEDAFLHYLEKLDQVARLEIVGMYLQKEQSEPVILHVFGRTYATAHIYFYRRLEGGVWSAWEKVELDIEGDHLIPVVWNRRLYLFWAIFTEKAEQPTKGLNEDDPNKYWEIKLVWSEYKNKSWSPKKVSKNPLRHNMYPYLTKEVSKLPPLDVPQKRQDFSFKTRILPSEAGEQLSIECYGTDVQKGGPTTRVVTPGSPAITVRRELMTSISSMTLSQAHANLNVNFPWHINVKFYIGGTSPPTPVEAVNTSVEFRTRDQNLFLEESPVVNGIARLTMATTTAVDCYLISKAYAVALGVPKTFYNGSDISRLNAIAVDIYLIPWSPTQKTDATYETVYLSPEVKLMQGIGEFTLADCNGDLTAVKVASAFMNPRELVPYKNTKIQGMQFVEDSDSGWLLYSANNYAILPVTPGIFRLLTPHQNAQLGPELLWGFFFQDDQGTYLLSLEGAFTRFAIHFHPRACEFINTLNRDRISGLLTLQNQLLTDSGGTFRRKYSPNTGYLSLNATPEENVDFEYQGSYSLYNWELFFHTPFLIATQLSKNQRFEEAQKWFHYIFDPTTTDSGRPGIERFWRVKPFYDEAIQGSIQTLESLIADTSETSELKKQVAKWEANPFKPHVIARMRVVAYMKAVVMRYIDNLIAWGDQLFRRDTIESINEATQLYILAAQILGRRPESIPARAKAKIQTFHTLDDVKTLDSLSNAMVEIESFLAPSVAPAPVAGDENAPPLTMQYFCITANDKLLGYWDTVADRLFKIRHCMNIEGVERSLPIFEPPIDPGLLVRAAAAGIDISSALNDINAAVPHYRFNVMVQKASELCNDVKALGGAFLSALEKRDAEALALLRSSQEVELLEAIREIKAQQIDEANNTLQGLTKYEEVVTTRQQYYLSRQFMNPFELGHIALATGSLIPMGAQLGAEVTAAVLHLIPDTKVGAATTIGATYGGRNVASAVQAFGSVMGTAASMLNTAASLSSTLGGYQRRQDDWTHQADLATKELQQVKKQIIAAEIRLAISEQELLNHDLQIENAKEVDDYMRHQKFTNQQLYSWMVGQLSGIYFQSYQLAYDVAKRAERTYRYELGLRDSNFIQFGYWDSLKKGLLSGERLYHDLKRMEVAYLDQNKREYEITKHVSLMQLDPVALLLLKETGKCEVNIPEALLDLDFPGHYLRRIKSVSLTIPCVTGPYSSVPCTLTLLKHSVRHSSSASGNYTRDIENEDSRFIDSFGAIQSIVTSSAQNDSGMFETNLRDERYLPFEGAGVISNWRLELPATFRPFDYSTISDVILHIRYTARDGGARLKQKCAEELGEILSAIERAGNETGMARLFSLRHEFHTEWHRLIGGTNPASTSDRTQSFAITKNRFPFLFTQKEITISAVDLYAVPKSNAGLIGFPGLGIKLPNATTVSPMQDGTKIGQLFAKTLTMENELAVGAEEGNARWEFRIPEADVAKFHDILMVCHYSI